MAKKEIKKMSGKSLNSQKELLSRLQREFPEVFTEGKVDCKKLQKTLGEDFEGEQERYGISWAGKSNVFREIQTPTTKTLRPDRDESVDFDNTDNLFIEGDNLEVLKALQKSYYGKVKMIYIDPPYNTGKDFIYSDKWARTRAEEAAENGGADENGNATRRDNLMVNDKSKGHFHSNWLNMMYPRLFLARNLMRQDGVIFVSIDDNEVHNLKMVMNEIFGEDNFVAQIIWQKIHSTKNDAKYFSDNHEYVLCYAKNIEVSKINLLPRTDKMNSRYQNKDHDQRGPWASGDLVANEERKNGYFLVRSPETNKSFNVPQGKHWVYTKDNLERMILEGRIYFGINGNAFPRLKRYLSEVQQGKKANTLWLAEEVGHYQDAKRELKKIFNSQSYFETPKPISLINQLLLLVSSDQDIILDFFAGSGTTAHAVMKLNAEDGGNRKCISVQLPEETSEKSEAYKAGYKTISDIAKERIRRAGKKVLEDSKEALEKRETPLDVGFKVLKLDESNFKVWQTDVTNEKELEQQMIEFVDNKANGATEEGMLYELLLKSGLQPTVEIEKKDGYYSIGDGQLIISLAEKMTNEIFTAILAEKPEKIIILDTAFAGDDQLKTNLLLQAEDAGVEEVLVV